MKTKHNRKAWFRSVKGIMKLFVRRTEFKFLGEGFKERGIVLSNHVGTSSPLAFELYGEKNIRFWGTHEMNDGLVSVYKYLSNIYYHQKKHWNLFAARMFCLIAAPLANMFYKGLRLIPTYPDYRLKRTMEESFKAINENNNVIIFPENSSTGYHDTLTMFHPGFVVFAKMCLKKGIDLPIYVCYNQRKNKTCVIDAPIMFSDLIKKYKTKEEIAKAMCDRCNELGQMKID